MIRCVITIAVLVFVGGMQAVNGAPCAPLSPQEGPTHASVDRQDSASAKDVARWPRPDVARAEEVGRHVGRTHDAVRDLARAQEVVRPQDAPPPPPAPGGKGPAVNLNTATASDLESVPGVGPSLAARIIEYRQKNGAFKKLDDLMNVRGIGEKSFLKLKPYIIVTPAKGERGTGA
jgi:competence ComEA-like helix-hairpin-helix protein